MRNETFVGLLSSSTTLASGVWKRVFTPSSASSTRRLSNSGVNATNAAALLPPEILLTVFDILRRRALYGTQQTDAFSDPDKRYRRPHARGYCDLLRVQHVCRTWRGPATAVLYAQVALYNATDLERFGRTIADQPQLLQHVQGLHFAREMLTEGSCDDMDQQRHLDALADLIGSECGPRELTLAWDAVRTISIEEEHAQSWDERRGAWDDSRVFGLRQCLARAQVTNLRLVAGDALCFVDVVVPARAGLYGLHGLTSLWLSRVELPDDGFPSTNPFPVLRTLRITECKVSPQWLVEAAAAIPTLVGLDLQNVTFNGEQPLAIADILGERCSSLTQLTTRDLRCTGPNGPTAVNLGQMNAFTALSLWHTSFDLFDQHDVVRLSFPPTITTVVVHMDNPSTKAPSKKPPRYPQHKLLSEIAIVSRRLAEWRRVAPVLRNVELWDQVGEETWRSWVMSSFLLKTRCESLGIDLDIHLRCA